MTETEIESAAGRFRTMIDRSFRGYGAKGGLPDALKAALRATPRHRFVHRFRLKDDSALHDFDSSPEELLPIVYSDAVMMHVDAAGAPLASSNSQPSYVLWLLNMLDLDRGHRVLEIGSGSGWLAAVMGRLVGAGGTVTGVEIISDLAERSRADLAATGVANVTIVTGDGTAAVAGGPFDRTIVTAATWDVTDDLAAAVAEGGLLLVPILLRAGGGCQVSLLRRVGETLIAEASMPGFFVPLIGPGQPPEHRPDSLGSGLRARGLDIEPVAVWPFPLGQAVPGQPGVAAWAFANHLRTVDPNFVTLAEGDGRQALAFGIADGSGSLALCRNGGLEAYGGRSAAERLAESYVLWAGLGMPGPGSYAFSVMRSEGAPASTETVHVEHRGSSALVRELKPAAQAWRSLLSDGSSRRS